MTKSKNQWGISGYELPKFDAKLDKPQTFMISHNKKTSYIDDAMKLSKHVPAPWQYDVTGFELVNPKKRSNLSKGKKMTFLDIV